jgi:hypothetical protein
MSTIVYCDRIRHVVTESRSRVAEVIDNRDGDFVYLTVDDGTGQGHQRALNVKKISSFEAMPGDGI